MVKKKRDLISQFNGLLQFVIKCLLFLILFFIQSFLIIKTSTKNIAQNPAVADFLTYYIGFSNPLHMQPSRYLIYIFLLVVFVLLTRKKLILFEQFPIQLNKSALYLLASFVIGFLLVIFRMLVASNPSLIDNYNLLMLFFKYLLPLAMGASLFLAVVGLDTLKYFFKNFDRELLISAFFAFVFFTYRRIIYTNWEVFTKGVILVISFLGKILPFEITYTEAGTLTISDLSLSIHKACSGIESQTLFFLLFLMIIFFDWEEINKVKAFILLVPGLVGMFLVNALRVFLLYLVGIYYSVEFAVGGFHSNIGWILFVLYFVGFQYLTYGFIRK